MADADKGHYKAKRGSSCKRCVFTEKSVDDGYFNAGGRTMKKLLLATVFVFCAATAQAKPYLDIQEITTPKGLSVWFVQDTSIPIMSLKFSLKGGAQLDPQHKEGTAELLSALFDEGAGERDAEEFQDLLDEYSIRMGFNAGRDSFDGSLKTTTKHQSVAVELLDDALNRPHFTNEAINRMKQGLLSSLRFRMMDPNYLASRSLFETIFKNHMYARAIEGTVESLPSISRNDLKREKNRLFCRERLKLSVVGALTAEQVSQIIDRVFGHWPSCDEPLHNMVQPLAAKGETITVLWQGAQSVMMMVQPGLARQDKDWWAARILDFALGTGQFSSRLMDEVRVKRGLTYGISTAMAPYDHAPLWFVQAAVDPSKVDEAVSVTKQIWADVAHHGLKESEIVEAKEYLIGSMPLALTSTDTIASIVLQLQEDGLPKNTLDIRGDEINAVTSDDIKRVAKARLKANELTTIIVGPIKK
jgi:zinc protease